MVSLHLLYEAFGDQSTERVTAWASAARTVELRSGQRVEVGSLDDLPRADRRAGLVLHFAYLTRDRVAELGVDAYLRANLEISHRVLDTVDRHRPSGLVYASSGAVYDAEGRPAGEVVENPYGAAKRLDELAFRAASRDVGASCVVPRIFSLTGPYMTKPNLYALGNMVAQARQGHEIRIRASRPVRRTYVAVVDLLAVCLGTVLEPRSDLVFDSGGETVEMAGLAETVKKVVGRPDLPIERVWDPEAPADDYVSDPRAFATLAGRLGIPLRTLDEQVHDTAADLVRRGEA